MTPSQEKSREQIAEEVYQLDGEDLQEHLIDARMELQTLARASECHLLTEEEAKELTKEYRTGDGTDERGNDVYAIPEKDVITLLMEHSNPSPVLEEVKKAIDIMDDFNNDCLARHDGTMDTAKFYAAGSAIHEAKRIITELSKGNKV